MNYHQIINTIYNYLFLEQARLENAVHTAARFITPERVSTERLQRYCVAVQRLEDFKRFSAAVADILRFYDE